MSNLYVTILAGGVGKRMQSTLPKVLHKVDDVPMLVRLIRQVKCMKPHKIVIIVGKFIDIIKETIIEYESSLDGIEFAIQEQPLGTGNAMLSSLSAYNTDGTVLILNGDNPLINVTTMTDAIKSFTDNKYELQITSLDANNPTGSGRIITVDGVFQKIVEEKDCSPEQKLIKVINCGIYIASTDVLKSCLPKIKNTNAQNEYYLTDIVEVYRQSYSKNVGLYTLPQEKELELCNVNTKDQLDELNNKLKKMTAN